MQTIKIQNRQIATALAEHLSTKGQIVCLQNVGSRTILTLRKVVDKSRKQSLCGSRLLST